MVKYHQTNCVALNNTPSPNFYKYHTCWLPGEQDLNHHIFKRLFA